MPKKSRRGRLFKGKGKDKNKSRTSAEDEIDQEDVYNEDVQCDKVNLTF